MTTVQEIELHFRSLCCSGISESLIDNHPDAVAGFDQQLRCTIWNRSMETISSKGKDLIIGRTILEVLPFLQENGDILARTLQGESLVCRRQPYLFRDGGQQGILDVYCSPLFDSAGAVVGGLCLIRDIVLGKFADEFLQPWKDTGELAVSTVPLIANDVLQRAICLAIHERRRLLGMSQEELSSRSGLHRTYISDIERGARNISCGNLNKLAFALGLRVSTLLAWSELKAAALLP